VKSILFKKGTAVFLVFFTFIYSCTKIRSTDLGSDLLPAIDNVVTFDTTLEVITNNYLFTDSASPRIGQDLSGNLPDEVLGYIGNDPQFGKTIGSIFIELRPPFYKYFFENVKDSLYLDSVVLCLKWTGTNGDTNSLQKIDVFQLDTKMKLDSAYKTNATFSYSNLMGSRTFVPNVLNDSLFLFEQSTKDLLRIRLSDAFGQSLLQQDSAAGQPYNRDSLFREFFPGFAIVPDHLGGGSSGNALMNFDVSDTSTCLRLYYRFTKNGQVDTTSRKFTINNGGGIGNANTVQRDYTGSQITGHLTTLPEGDSLVYIQTTPGSYALVQIPSLDSFKAAKGNVILHRVELSMQQIHSPGELSEIFSVPNFLYIDYFDTATQKQTPLVEDGFANNQYQPALLGGVRKYVQDNSGNTVAEYRFTITRHVQRIITRNDVNYPFHLYAPFAVSYSNILGQGLNPLAFGRVKLGGGTHSANKMKLRIIYSRI
jgi:Domain of unknown function (DUF4270)